MPWFIPELIHNSRDSWKVSVIVLVFIHKTKVQSICHGSLTMPGFSHCTGVQCILCPGLCQGSVNMSRYISCNVPQYLVEVLGFSYYGFCRFGKRDLLLLGILKQELEINPLQSIDLLQRDNLTRCCIFFTDSSFNYILHIYVAAYTVFVFKFCLVRTTSN